MAVNYNPRIVTDGLVLALDAANTKSYPSNGGSTWYDLSGNNNNATLYNTPTFDSSLGGGVITFNGSNESGLVSTLNFASSDHTIMAIGKYNTASGRLISSYSNNWVMGWHGTPTGYIDRFYAGAWVAQSSSSSSTDFYCYAATGDISGDTWKLYKNGSLFVSNSNGSIGPNQISLGRHATNEYSNCSIGIVMAYNRVLTAAEIKQNFNAYRGRYGI